MSEQSFAKAHLSEIERRDEWVLIRRHLGIEAFGVNGWMANEAGGKLISEHDEKQVEHEELYFVVDGHATFTIAGEIVDAPAGTLVFVRDPEVRRGAVAKEAGTTVLAIGAKAGEAFSVSPWESVGEAFREGDYAGAKELLLKLIERQPEQAGHLYNLACAQARLGESEAALEHLLTAVGREERLRELAQTDEDLDSIRENPRFPR